ncbi:MAG: nitroreductase/quinone reductase family protein [Chloroflexota bacterium]
MVNDNFTRWMYRGHRPNWLAKFMNNTGAVLAATGITGNRMIMFEVRGRKSGKMVSLPLVVGIVDGQRYLVSMLGQDVQWVKNVQAAGGQAVIVSGRREAVHLEDVPVDQRAPILKNYLGRAPGARPHMQVNKDAPLAEFEKVAADYPVFHVVSVKSAD